jgi:hypothetical protein
MLDVIGWGAHRYRGSAPAAPSVALQFRHGPYGSGQVTVDIDLNLEQARALAAAIIEAADRAAAAPFGDEEEVR